MTSHTACTAWAALVSALVLVLGGCKPTDGMGASAHPAMATTGAKQTAAQADAPGESVMTDSVNYMHERAVRYTLYDLSQKPPVAVGGAVVRMLATGGEKGCCLKLPATWHPGMKVRVDWDEGDRDVIYPEKYSKELEIPRYDQAADLYVVFYPNHEIEVVVSVGEPGQANWAGKVKATPWENCLAHHERKVCKAALPKQFDVDSSRGACVFAKSGKYPGSIEEAKEYCNFSMYECMRDYEDEPFCKSVVWGERRK